MNAEQITTIITNVLTGTGVVCFLGMVIRGLKNQISGLKTQIGTLNETIDVQKRTLEAMETRVLETEKVGNIYKRLTEELPAEIDKYRSLITKLKDDQISELEKANQDKDEKLKKTAELEIEKLNLQQQALEDIPGLRHELIEVVTTLQQRLATVEQLSRFPRPEVSRLGDVYKVKTGGTVFVTSNPESVIHHISSDS
jgi:chromosome segregation ATPase